MQINHVIQKLHSDPSFIPLNPGFAFDYFNDRDFHSFPIGHNDFHYVFSPSLAEKVLSTKNLLPSPPIFGSGCSPDISSFICKFPVFSNQVVHHGYRRFIGKSYLKQSHLICEDLAYRYLLDSLSNIKSGELLHQKLSDVTLKINSKILNLHPVISHLFKMLTPQFAAAFKHYPFDFSSISIDILQTLKDEEKRLLSCNEIISSFDQSIESLFFTFFSGSDTLTSLFETYLYLKSRPSLLPKTIISDVDYVDYIIKQYPYFRFIARSAHVDTQIGGLSVKLNDNLLISLQVVNSLMSQFGERHMTFGFGEYSCIGRFVSPIVLKVFINLVNSNYPKLSLVSDGFANHPVLTFVTDPYVC